MPFEFYVSRICEEFSCVPSEAIREMGRWPDGFLERVIEARTYIATKAQIDAAKTADQKPTGAMADAVDEIGAALAAEELATHGTAALDHS